MEVKKSDLILTILFKTLNNVCWYLFGLSFLFFIKNEITSKEIIRLICTLIIIYVFKIIFKYAYDKIANKTYYSIKHNIELNYFKKVLNIKTEVIQKMNLNNLSNLILNISYYKTKLYYDLGNVVIPTLIGILILIILSFTINIIMGFLTIILICLILLFRYKNTKLKQVVNENNLLIDFVQKIIIIKKLNVFDFFINKINNNKDVFIKLRNDHEQETKYNIVIALFLIYTLTFIFIFLNNAILQLSYIISFIILIIKLQNLIYDSTYFILNLNEYNKNKIEIEKYFNKLIKRKANRRWKKIRIKNGIIKYTNLSINIPDFELIKGDHISIMGASGQGKSTILNILSGVYNLDQGEIYFDNTVSKNIVDALYLSKNTELFKLTLRENLTLGINISDEEIINMLKILNLSNWYNTLPNGLDTIINEKLSNSTLQKLNFIKAMIIDKDIYFLDEPTTDLDIETEKIISNLIKNNFKNKTIIIVTHRPLITTICQKHYFMKNHTLLESEPLL